MARSEKCGRPGPSSRADRTSGDRAVQGDGGGGAEAKRGRPHPSHWRWQFDTINLAAREDITEEVILAGDYLVEIGHYSYQGTSKTDNKTPRSVAGWYMVLWRKDADGVWRLHRNIGNDAPTKKNDAPTKPTKRS